MSSQPRSNGGEYNVQQDYVARIRYSNALPPPPFPPKLLEIPNVGLASGQYTEPGFASRLAREQPLNIEADAELGMPLDLVGMPGVFDGDESSIQAPSEPPPLHPTDRLLLRPVSALGKLKAIDANVSFLRRTEYISSHGVKPRPDARPRADPFLRQKPQRPEKRKLSPEPDKGTPAWIKRRIEKSFEVAARNLANKSGVKHPKKGNLKLVDAYPLIPDNDAFPDSGAYVTIKFQTNPVASGDRYDERMAAGIFKPIERSAAEDARYEAAVQAYNRDPKNYERPHNMMNYNLFLAQDEDTAHRFRRRFDVDNADRDDPSLYPLGKEAFVFPRLRAYETIHEKEMDHSTKYDHEVILACRDDDKVAGGKVIFYYPVMQKSTIRNQRGRNIARNSGVIDDEEPAADELHVTVNEPSESLKQDLLRMREDPFCLYEEDDEDVEQTGEAPEEIGHGDAAADGGVSDHDQDAEGDEEE